LALLPAVGSPAPVRTPEAHRRGTEQTFLTFPEWFLVFSPAEYAAFVQTQPPSRFPFAGHVAQFWNGYGHVYEATKPYPPNSEYHVMIVVIGVSTSVEYGLRLAYETLVGRLSELTTDYPQTDEDRLAARVSQEYVDFIRVRPWYEFDFVSALRRLWGTSLWGDGLLRKWERKYALTTEYGVKAVYGWLMMKATHASYGEAVPVTMAVIRDGREAATLPEMETVERLPDGGRLVSLPRYEAFTTATRALARQGAAFEEIAGNRDVILVTALVGPEDPPMPAGVSVLFAQPILTQPGRRRLAYVVPVAAVADAVRGLEAAPHASLEHVFDY
jgi:hypothetical protein